MKTELHPAIAENLQKFIKEDFLLLISSKKTFSKERIRFFYECVQEFYSLREEGKDLREELLLLEEAMVITSSYFLENGSNTVGWKQYFNVLVSSLNLVVEKKELSTAPSPEEQPKYLYLYNSLYQAVESRPTLNLSTLKRIQIAIVSKHGKDLEEVQLDLVKAFFNRYYLFFKRELLSKGYYFLHKEDSLRLFKEAVETFKV